MDDLTGNISEVTFKNGLQCFEGLNADTVVKLIGANCDLIIRVGPDDAIKDTAFSIDAISANGGRGWIDRSIFETVTPECKDKVTELLSEARKGKVSKPREVNHRMLENDDLPVVYKCIALGEAGDIIMMGQDISRIASLQRRLMSSQLSMEREVSKLRGSESRFRGMFQVSEVPQVVVDASSLKIVDANNSAVRLMGKSGQKIDGRKLPSLFGSNDADILHKILFSAIDESDDQRKLIELENGQSLNIKASVFKQEDASYLLVQFFEASEKASPVIETTQEKMLALVNQMPDAFVVTNPDRTILTANNSFYGLLNLSGPRDVEGVPLDTFFDRPSVDGNVLLANVREHGVVKRFATVLRSRYGQLINVEIAACQLVSSNEDVLGFWLRQTNNIVMGSDVEQENINRSNEQISNLVGHMPLKDIVKETTEMIEKLCIETALELTQNNRASAAQMLGLSRQSLYSKLGKDKD